jgi:hypothetical protein
MVKRNGFAFAPNTIRRACGVTLLAKFILIGFKNSFLNGMMISKLGNYLLLFIKCVSVLFYPETQNKNSDNKCS